MVNPQSQIKKSKSDARGKGMKTVVPASEIDLAAVINLRRRSMSNNKNNSVKRKKTSRKKKIERCVRSRMLKKGSTLHSK